MPCLNSNPAWTRRSSADPSFVSFSVATEANSACENLRPITAPICAISLAGPSRSSRAISDACKLAGTAIVAAGTAASVRRAAPSLSDSSTAFVISSTNRGMPSVRSTISSITSGGSVFSPTRRSMIAVMSCFPSRLSVTLVTLAWPTHGGSNSGRNVTISKAGRPETRSTVRLSSSRLVGSIQCTSSNTISTGCWRASASNCASRACKVRCRRRGESSVRAG